MMRAHPSTRLALSALGLALLHASTGAAQSTAGATQQGPDRIPAFGRSVATVDDSTALVANPANLVVVPGAEVRWQGVYLRDDAEVPYKGHSLGVAVPVDGHVGFGMRADFLNPPPGNTSAIEERYNWLTWGVAAGSELGSVGVSLERSYSNSALAHSLVSWSAGATLRPLNSLAFAVVVSHFNAPQNDFGGSIDRTADFALALRPAGTKAVELGLETRLVDPVAGDRFWVPRATLGVDIPRVGRLHGDLAFTDLAEQVGRQSAWLASAGLDVHLNGAKAAVEVGGGALFGDRLGENAKDRPWENAYSDVAVKLYREPQGVDQHIALSIRIEKTPDTREHVALLRELWRIAERERTIDAVVLELRDAPAESMARAQELRDAIRYLRVHGKRVLCHLEDNKGTELYTCAGADQILINPAGAIRFAGLKSNRLYYARLLENLGIHADFVRIGAHKSAPESWTRDGGTDVAKADRVALMQEFERYFVGAVASGRKISVEDVRARVAKGPFTATEAYTAQFVDGYAFDDQIEERVQALVGRKVKLVKQDELTPRANPRFGVGARVALVYAAGAIADGRSRGVPLVGMNTIGSYSFAETLRELRADDTIKAVVLRIDSPGGSAMASDVIWREVHLLAEQKPVIVSMGTVAASGGYYIAVPATRIYANPLTITGSIGIYYGKADAAVLMKRLGVSSEVVKSAPSADADSLFRPYTDEERKALEVKIGQYYDVFLDRVATGRELTKEAVDKVGQGRVWTGEQAVTEHLVDEVGGLRQALDFAREAAGLPRHAPIIELPKPEGTLLGKALGLEGVRSKVRLGELPAPITELARAVAPFVLYTPDEPLALLDLVEVP